MAASAVAPGGSGGWSTWRLRAWSLRHIPLLFFLSPSVVEAGDSRAIIRVPLNWRTRNHLGSMYFAALCAGADCAVAVLGLRALARAPGVHVIFRDTRVEFLKRAEGDVHFLCEDGREIRELLERAKRTGQRETLKLRVLATVPEKLGDEPVAIFEMTLSAKART
jgi:hypothetical protein